MPAGGAPVKMKKNMEAGAKMRVVAGQAKGIKLKAPPGLKVRPTADRVKEALFSILGGRVSGAAVVDLYAGSGALGIEALSRGAAVCVFVEKNSRHMAVVKVNLEKTGLADRGRLLRCDARQAPALLQREQFRADLIFLDPPYGSGEIPAVLEEIASRGILGGDGLIVVEHAARAQSWSGLFPGSRRKRYGDTALTFLECRDLREAQRQPGI